MIQKKICMLGAFAVGKTSLVRRFVESIFSDKYQTTIGVKIDKKLVTVGDQTVNLVLWDMAGEDGYEKIRPSYLRGASGYLLVVDKTRSNTLDTALAIHDRFFEVLGKVPCILLFNKSDLMGKWDIDDKAVANLIQDGWEIIHTSAKTGLGVEDAFQTLTRKMIEQ